MSGIRARKIVGSMLKRARKEHGLTQVELGKKLNVSGVFVALMENGSRPFPPAIMPKLFKTLPQIKRKVSKTLGICPECLGSGTCG